MTLGTLAKHQNKKVAQLKGAVQSEETVTWQALLTVQHNTLIPLSLRKPNVLRNA